MRTLLGLSQLQFQALLVHLDACQPLFYFTRLAGSALQLLLNLHNTEAVCCTIIPTETLLIVDLDLTFNCCSRKCAL